MQLAITNPNGPLTMTSREIAELTEKAHTNVLRDIRVMLVDLNITELSFESSYQDTTGRTLPMFALPKRECLILVSGYSVALRAKIIDRWQELEDQAADPMLALRDPATMRALLLDYAEHVLRLEGQVAELAPKAVALDRISKATFGSTCIREVARRSRMQQNAARRSGLQQPEHGRKPAQRSTGAPARSCPETHLGLADARRCAGWRPDVRQEGASS